MNRSASTFVAAVLLVACARPREPADTVKSRNPGLDQEVPAPVSYSFRSDIPDCLEVKGKSTITEANLLLAVVELKTKQITASCGCPSRWLLWRSVTAKDGIETELASGSVLAAAPGDKARESRIVLLGDRDNPPVEPLVAHVGCAPAP